MKVLVTGCNGQVGSSLVLQLQSQGSEVLGVDRDELDITNYEAVQKFIHSFKPDVVINAAAHTAVDKAEEEVELSYSINRDGPKFLAQAAENVGAAILHISTDYVFSGNGLGQYSESDLTDPQGVYGASKLAGEDEVQNNCSKHIILRTAWVFGEHGNNFVKTMLRLGVQRDSLGIVADQFGGPTYAGDIAAALIKIANDISSGKPVEYGVYHFAGLPHVSWYEFATEIFNVAERKELISKKPELSALTTEQYPTPAKRPANSKLSTQKIQKVFGIQASDWIKALSNIEQYID